ncbi:MAG TPA: hypothetical protein VIH27_01230 [Nitrososphaerales archaeon]
MNKVTVNLESVVCLHKHFWCLIEYGQMILICKDCNYETNNLLLAKQAAVTFLAGPPNVLH